MSDVIVEVEGNLVVSIRRRERHVGESPPGSPLEVGTALATAFRETGRLDGSYRFADADAAREFATLCLRFVKALVEQRVAAVDSLPAGFESYTVKPETPTGG